jgi:6-pyruvoyltetrahydropterin/6-carboxytetrahydropterin synthase
MTTTAIFELSQSFIFEAAHTLHRTVPLAEFESSARIHGHTYQAEITIRGTKGESGMIEFARPGKVGPLVVDLFVLRGIVAKILEYLDHQFLDEVQDLGPATLENLCEFIATKASESIPVHAVTVSRAAGDKCRLIVGPQ